MGSSTEYRQEMDKLGNEVRVRLLEEFAHYLKQERTFWRSVAHDAGMKF